MSLVYHKAIHTSVRQISEVWLNHSPPGLRAQCAVYSVCAGIHCRAVWFLGNLRLIAWGERGHVTKEHTLLERAREYNLDALGEIYDRYAPLVYAYIYRRVHDAHLAEDLTSEVFVRVLRAIQSQRFWRTSFRGWLYRIAHNLVVDHYRGQPAVPPLPLDEGLIQDGSGPDTEVAKRFSRQRLWKALQRLTPTQQQVISLRFGEQLTAREVAEVMDKSIGAVEALQHRALAALQRIMEEE